MYIFLGSYVDETTKRQLEALLAKRRLTEQAAFEEMWDDPFSSMASSGLGGG